MRRQDILKLPTTTGIYIFTRGSEILYIGKSVNIKSRILSHIENAKIDVKEAGIVQNADSISCIITDSEFKALLLESQLIRKHKPKYNARWRDDKSPLYIKITVKDTYPKIFSTRKEFDKKSKYFGPFPSVKSVYEILREIRRVFPFCTQKNIIKRPCFHSKINLCNPCPNVIEQIENKKEKQRLHKQYRKNIRSIIKVLNGKTDPVLGDLYKLLKKLAAEERYEEALVVRNKIAHFENLLHRKLFSPDITPNFNMATESVASLIHLLKPFFSPIERLHRIECYDVSNFSQKDATASMVVFTEGLIDKKEYRKFKIKNPALNSDFEMMQEVFQRRFTRHGTGALDQWEHPDLLVVDGGKPQLRMVIAVLQSLRVTTPIIGIAKHPDRLVMGVDHLPMIRPSIHQLGFNMVRALRDESHRFAKKYHVFLRDKKIGI